MVGHDVGQHFPIFQFVVVEKRKSRKQQIKNRKKPEENLIEKMRIEKEGVRKKRKKTKRTKIRRKKVSTYSSTCSTDSNNANVIFAGVPSTSTSFSYCSRERPILCNCG